MTTVTHAPLLDLEAYRPLALRTCQQLSAQRLFEHATLGMFAEAGEILGILVKHRFQGHELKLEKLIEELGDVQWHVIEAAHAKGLDPKRFEGPLQRVRFPGINGMLFAATRLASECGRVVELYEQSQWAYDVSDRAGVTDSHFLDGLTNVQSRIETLAYALGTSGDAVRASNISKLKLRYPQGFTSHASINRRD